MEVSNDDTAVAPKTVEGQVTLKEKTKTDYLVKGAGKRYVHNHLLYVDANLIACKRNSENENTKELLNCVQSFDIERT
ncbi:hypothetical protein Tco_0993157 [Tanacetum coccineum]|uniref:Uncharacterized protein n=1 Tax=Tanacetum coccineum TaxID=301880 RepID=A0ABQ5F4V3_9ASTR